MGINKIKAALVKNKKEMKRNSSYTWKKREFVVYCSDWRREKKGMVGLVWRFKTGGVRKGEFDELKGNPSQKNTRKKERKRKKKVMEVVCVVVQGNVPTFASV